MAKLLAEKLSVSQQRSVDREYLNDFQGNLKRQADFVASNQNDSNQTVVLIVDRREDAITPLLNQV